MDNMWSGRTGCPAALILAVMQQESGGQPNVTRYEAEYKDRYGKSTKFRDILVATGYEPEDVATSYGLMQLMLPLAWGYMSANQKNESAKIYLLDPEQNIRYGAAHLTALLQKNTLFDVNNKNKNLFGDEVRRVAGAYNGAGSDSAYARNVCALWQRYEAWLKEAFAHEN
ncbi:MAG: transglycosylase SLT domain-containing protein [Tannerellaceae bacterium]